MPLFALPNSLVADDESHLGRRVCVNNKTLGAPADGFPFPLAWPCLQYQALLGEAKLCCFMAEAQFSFFSASPLLVVPTAFLE